MSDNDLIRRGVIKERMIARGWKHPDSTVTEFVEDDLPAVPQEMTAREYLHEFVRMCNANTNAELRLCGAKCPMFDAAEGSVIRCKIWAYYHPDKAVSIVEKWAREHPEERSEE